MNKKTILASDVISNLPTTKNGILAVLDNKSKDLSTEMITSPCHTMAYYKGLLHLLDNVIVELASRNIFTAPEGWYYSFLITSTEATLSIKHASSVNMDNSRPAPERVEVEFDEAFKLMSRPVPTMTVEEYAKANEIEQVTVRQWIRRGKLRSAVKIGGEWRIQEFADTPSRGYTSVRYYNDKRPLVLPNEYKCQIHNPSYIDILPSKERRGYCQILLDGVPAKLSGELIPDSEREKIELALISTPGMRNSASILVRIPDVLENDSRMRVRRSGKARLAKDGNLLFEDM